MKTSTAIRISAAAGFVGVALGAFGAHGLSERLAGFQTVEIWEKAVLYHLVHAVILVVLSRHGFSRGPWICFLAGIVIFSGSLYLLAAFNLRWLGAVTPIGGLSFLAGWVGLMRSAGLDSNRGNVSENQL